METNDEGQADTTIIGDGRLLLEVLPDGLVLSAPRAGPGERPTISIENQDVLPLIEALTLRHAELQEQTKAAAWRSQALLEPERVYTEAGTCRSCGKRMAFAVSRKNRVATPVDLDEAGRPVGSHFSTCPDAKGWSKGRGRG